MPDVTAPLPEQMDSPSSSPNAANTPAPAANTPVQDQSDEGSGLVSPDDEGVKKAVQLTKSKGQPPQKNQPAEAPEAPTPKEEAPAKTPPAKSSGKVVGVKGTEFGEVDNPIYGGYTEAGWNIGAWGANLAGKDNVGFALPPSVLQHVGFNFQKGYGNTFNSQYTIRVTNPKNGATVDGPLKDLGPGVSTGATVDMLYGARAALGLPVNFSGAVNVEIIDKKTGQVVYAPSGHEMAEGGGGGLGHGGGGGGGGGGDGGGTPGFGGGPIPGIGGGEEEEPQAQPIQAYEGPRLQPASQSGSGDYGGGYVADTGSATTPAYPGFIPQMSMASSLGGQSNLGPMEAMQMGLAEGGGSPVQALNISARAPAAPGVSFMPRKGSKLKLGSITPESEEEEEPVESTLGQPNVKGFEGLKPLTSQNTAKTTTAAQKLHASLLSHDDTRVKKQADNYFKGEHFVEGDPMHEHMLSQTPVHDRLGLAAGQQAIQNKVPMHISYISAPVSGEKESPITRQSREIDSREMSTPQQRLLGQANGRLAGHTFIPTAIGIGQNRAKGATDKYSGYINGISTNVAAHNHYHLNQALAAMGQESPYPELNSSRFRNDMAAYIQNLQQGHRGAGHGYAPGTEALPSTPNRSYRPVRLEQREADFLNAIINNQAAHHQKPYQELAKKAGTLLTESGEVNPIRHEIDVHDATSRGATPEEIKDPHIKSAAQDAWSKRVLEPTIRSFTAGLIHQIHEHPNDIPEAIRPKMPGYAELTQTLGRELGGEKGRPDVGLGVGFMPRKGSKYEPPALTPEEHAELSGNIRKQWLSGKLRTPEYMERMKEVPEVGEPLGVHYMPMAGSKAKGFAEAQKGGKTFEIPGMGGPRFEIDDRDMTFKPAPPLTEYQKSLGLKPSRNAIEAAHKDYTRREPLYLDEAIEHPELFRQYPFLRGTAIRMEPGMGPNTGYYRHGYIDENGDGQGGMIALRDPTNKETLIHEIQHAVQYHEQWPGRGTSPDEVRDNLEHDFGVKHELNKQWGAENPNYAQEVDRLQHEITQESRSPLERDDARKQLFTIRRFQDAWRHNQLRNMAHAIYQLEPGEIEARVAGKRAMEHTASPEEAMRQEMQSAAWRARKEGAASSIYDRPNYYTPPASSAEAAPEEPLGVHFMARQGSQMQPVAKVSKSIQKRLGPRPEDEKQARIWDLMAARMGKEVEGAIPLRPKRNDKGELVEDAKGPKYELEDYDIANAPMLKKQGKALGFDENGAMKKAPEGTVDKLDPEDLYYLKYNKDGTPSDDRLRVSHLNEVSAVHSYADKLVDFFHSVKDDPEVMRAQGWYPEVEQLLKEHFGEHANMAAHVLAALSAGTGVRPNFTMAMNALERYLHGDFRGMIDLYRKGYQMKNAGTLQQHLVDQGIHDKLLPNNHEGQVEAMARYIMHHDLNPVQLHGKVNPKTGLFEGTKYGFNSKALMKVLAETWLEEVEGPKTANYGGNLSGRTLQATIDMWAARTMRRLGYDGHTNKPWLLAAPAETGVNNVDFGLSQLAFREAAKRLDMEPRVLQAVLWFAEQKHYANNGWEKWVDPAERDYRPMLKELMVHGPLTTHLPGQEPKLRTGEQRARIPKEQYVPYSAPAGAQPQKFAEGGPVAPAYAPPPTYGVPQPPVPRPKPAKNGSVAPAYTAPPAYGVPEGPAPGPKPGPVPAPTPRPVAQVIDPSELGNLPGRPLADQLADRRDPNWVYKGMALALGYSEDTMKFMDTTGAWDNPVDQENLSNEYNRKFAGGDYSGTVGFRGPMDTGKGTEKGGHAGVSGSTIGTIKEGLQSGKGGWLPKDISEGASPYPSPSPEPPIQRPPPSPPKTQRQLYKERTGKDVPSSLENE